MKNQSQITHLRTAIEMSKVTPTPEEVADAPQLDAWFLARDMDRTVISGETRSHPELSPGRVLTSPVLAMDANAGWVRTCSRIYRLGAEMRHDDPAMARETSKFLKRDDPRLLPTRLRSNLQEIEKQLRVLER